MGYAKRTDRNHAVVRDALRQAGWFVKDCSAIGGGWPDLFAAKPGRCLLVEVKNGAKSASRRQLTAAQVQLHKELAAAGFPVVILTSVDQVAEL